MARLGYRDSLYVLAKSLGFPKVQLSDKCVNGTGQDWYTFAHFAPKHLVLQAQYHLESMRKLAEQAKA